MHIVLVASVGDSETLAGIGRPDRSAERCARAKQTERGTKNFIVGVHPNMLIYMIQLSSVRGKEEEIV